MYDYIKLEKYLESQEKINLDSLQWKATYGSGIKRYSISIGFNALKVCIDEQGHKLMIDGSFPYFWQGHNFRFSNENLYNTIESLEEKLQISIINASIKVFESGIVLELDIPLKEILKKHLSLKKYQKIEFEKGIYFINSILKLKLYDAGFRIKSVAKSAMKDLIENFGFDKTKNYLRVENHFIKPEIHFKNRNITLETLLSVAFEKECNSSLIENYKSIKKSKQFVLPKSKKDLNSANILLLYLNQLSAQYDFDVEDGLSDFFKSIPPDILPNEDRKKRKRQIRIYSDGLKSCERLFIDYDLTEKIEKSFY